MNKHLKYFACGLALTTALAGLYLLCKYYPSIIGILMMATLTYGIGFLLYKQLFENER